MSNKGLFTCVQAGEICLIAVLNQSKKITPMNTTTVNTDIKHRYNR